MALKLSKERVFDYPVTISYYDENGKIKTGTFTATFKVLKLSELDNEDNRGMLDAILKSVKGLELEDSNGNVFEGDDLVEAVKDDADLAEACVRAYTQAMEKKREATEKTLKK